MLINPLKTEEKRNSYSQFETNKDKVINEIIVFLITNYSEYLGEIDINRQIVENIVREKVYKEYSSMNTDATIDAILDRLFGYHILQKFIDDEEVTDIRVITYDSIFVKKNGIWIRTFEKFYSESDFLNFVRYCVLKNGGKISNENPIVTCSDRKNNLRIEAGIEPVNISSPSLVIRIHRKNKITSLEELASDEIQMVNKDISVLLSKLIISGCNIVISGKGGSGKTTLMRTLINRIPQNLSITSCEETAELFSTHPNIIQREILSNRNDDKNITLSNLMTHSLVMSNDCIVVGELKGEEALLFFDSVSTGHRGYATVHSDSSLNTVDRLVTLMKRDNRAQMYTDTYLTKLLAQSIDVVIYMENFKVQEITEINYNSELQEVQYNPLYVFDVEKYENGKSIGTFKKKNSPKWKAKKKLELSKMEIEKVI